MARQSSRPVRYGTRHPDRFVKFFCQQCWDESIKERRKTAEDNKPKLDLCRERLGRMLNAARSSNQRSKSPSYMLVRNLCTRSELYWIMTTHSDGDTNIWSRNCLEIYRS